MLVWRYSDNAGAIIENVNKFCMKEEKPGMKPSLNRVGDRTAALTGASRSTAQKIVLFCLFDLILNVPSTIF